MNLDERIGDITDSFSDDTLAADHVVVDDTGEGKDYAVVVLLDEEDGRIILRGNAAIQPPTTIAVRIDGGRRYAEDDVGLARLFCHRYWTQEAEVGLKSRSEEN